MTLRDWHLILLNGREQDDCYCWKNLYIIPEFRRSGIAIASYNYAIDMLRKNKGIRMLGFVQEGNGKSLNFVTKSLNAYSIGKLKFKNRFGFKNCYYENLQGTLKKLSFPARHKYHD